MTLKNKQDGAYSYIKQILANDKKYIWARKRLDAARESLANSIESLDPKKRAEILETIDELIEASQELGSIKGIIAGKLVLEFEVMKNE